MVIKSRWLVVSLVIVALIGLAFLWMYWPDPRMLEAKRDVLKIESFRKAHGRLPNALSEIGVKEDESGPVYYQRQGDAKYILWYGLSLGESEVYDSSSRSWSEHP